MTPSAETHHVDVAQAEVQFAELERVLTALSAEGEAESPHHHDPEKGELAFDLRGYLSSSSEAAQQAGIAHKHLGVTWEDLRVDGVGGIDHKIYASTFGHDALGFWLFPYRFARTLLEKAIPAIRPHISLTTILHTQSGLLKPGEMCLVLGCPGSGCTTFLKALGNRREDYAQVFGDVRYAGIDAHEMQKYYKGEVVYNEEDDRHIATLTVAQTLGFALSLKTPGPNGRLPGVSRKEFDMTIGDTILKMLNISHTTDTYVGDAFVRGVSGGERKRVSIAESMATRAHVLCFDNSTRGLDASTALDFIKAMRIMTDVLGQTTFATLYQAGEGIYELFDKVLVLDKGRQVYFGPPSEARSYFESLGYKSLPRQSTPDYLTGCTDPHERQFAPGRSEHDVPCTPQALEKAFLESQLARDMLRDLQEFKKKMEMDKTDQEAFRAAVLADKKRGVSKKSPYTLSFTSQVRALTIRQLRMRIQDKFQLATSFGLSAVLALVIGAAYYDLQPTSRGGYIRGSVIYTALLNCCLDTMGEMPSQMLGRPIFNKQTKYALYRPAAVVVANTLSDVPFSATRILIFNLIVYFMTNLARSAGGFFTYHIFVYLSFLAMQGLFRTFGIVCSSFDFAFRLISFFTPNIVQYVGFMIPVFQMKRWLFWNYYLNPAAYAWAALMENEFMRVDLACDGDSIVPRNPPGVDKYPVGLGPNQICTLSGSVPGQSLVLGPDYISSGYGLNVSDIWRRNFIVLVGFALVFQLTQVFLIEYIQHPDGASSGSAIFAKENSETKELNTALTRRKSRRRERYKSETEGTADEASATTKFHGKPFTWENINYCVPVHGGPLRLLHNICGYVKPGTMTALMGASGAGKTTCLDVLAQRKNIGIVSGTLLLDGKTLGLDFARNTAYAEQMDVHEGTATVREAMRFSAYLRQPPEVHKEDKDQYVEEMIEVLELQDLADALVFSLSVEARKRLTIGVELASRPTLLFLDEPTSGLDGQSAWNLVRFLRKLADNGQAILCTIHQPSALLIQTFDKLLLLERGGEPVYFGDIGPDCQILRDYFARHGAECPHNVNPAEFMLDAIGAGLTPRIGDRDWKDHWPASQEYKDVRAEIERIKQNAPSGDDSQAQVTRYATSFWHQLRYVVRRNNTKLWRSPNYVFSRVFVHAIISLWVSLSYLQLGNSVRDLQYRVFSVFWITILPVVIMGQLEPMWIVSRQIFIREASSRIYSPYVFAIGQLIGEVPYSLLCAIVYWLLMVFPTGFGKGSAGVGGEFFQLLVLVFLELFGVSLGQLIGAVTPSMQVAPLFNPFISLVLGTFCGTLLPYSTMPTYWRWLYQLSPFTRALAAMLSTELHGLVIKCQAEEFATFNPPSGQTCAAWADEFVQGFGGYLDNPNDTAGCRYCQYSVGDEFYTPLNYNYDDRWRDAWILFAFTVFNLIATTIASRYIRYAKR